MTISDFEDDSMTSSDFEDEAERIKASPANCFTKASQLEILASRIVRLNWNDVTMHKIKKLAKQWRVEAEELRNEA